MHLQENTVFGLDLEMLPHVTYSGTKFEVATSNA